MECFVPVKQGLHDRFASSALVRPANRTSGGLAVGCLAVVIVIGLLFVAVVAALIFLGSQGGPLTQPGTTI